jgi:hypothetical protein
MPPAPARSLRPALLLLLLLLLLLGLILVCRV